MILFPCLVEYLHPKHAPPLTEMLKNHVIANPCPTNLIPTTHISNTLHLLLCQTTRLCTTITMPSIYLSTGCFFCIVFLHSTYRLWSIFLIFLWRRQPCILCFARLVLICFAYSLMLGLWHCSLMLNINPVYFKSCLKPSYKNIWADACLSLD